MANHQPTGRIYISNLLRAPRYAAKEASHDGGSCRPCTMVSSITLPDSFDSQVTMETIAKTGYRPGKSRRRYSHTFQVQVVATSLTAPSTRWIPRVHRTLSLFRLPTTSPPNYFITAADRSTAATGSGGLMLVTLFRQSYPLSLTRLSRSVPQLPHAIARHAFLCFDHSESTKVAFGPFLVPFVPSPWPMLIS